MHNQLKKSIQLMTIADDIKIINTQGRQERQCTTRGIKHWGLSGYASILPRIKFGVTGQEGSTQSPTISYRIPR